MRSDKVHALLQQMGMTGYAAKAYVALVAAGQPLNGYAVAKASGVPRSTIYETLGKLVTQGAAFEVHTEPASSSYLALPPATFLARLRREFSDAHEQLSEALPLVAGVPRTHLVHNLRGTESVLNRALDLVHGSSEDLFVSIWSEEAKALNPALQQAVGRGITVHIVSFAPEPEDIGNTSAHQFSKPDTVFARLGCRLLVVAADCREVLIGGSRDDDTWGLYSDDPAVVLLAIEFIRHDIAMQVLVERLGPTEVEAFWESDPALNSMRGRSR